MAEPLAYTLLSLPRYAQIMGINPVHFQGALGSTIWPLKNNRCTDLWPRYSWQQSDLISHDDLAIAIQSAEEDMARVLGFHPAPKWMEEVHKYPKFYRPNVLDGGGFQFASANHRKSVNTRWGKVISGGRRGTTLIDTPTVVGGEIVFSDSTGDGFTDAVTITVATTVTEICELKLYFAGQAADRRWEIRPVRSKTLAGGNVVFVLDAWLLIDPDIQAVAPTDANFQGINLDTTANYVTSVDVYREFNDLTAVASQFFWEPTECSICSNCQLTIGGGPALVAGAADTSSATCPLCNLTAQDGCLLIRDVDTGIVVPAPASLNDDNDFTIQQFAVARDPDIVKVWYYAGDIDEFRLEDTRCQMLSDRYARLIAWIATSRLERKFCSCGNATALATELRTDLAFTGTDTAFLVDFNDLGNPLGTRKGEMMAWKALSKLGDRIYEAFSI